MEASWLCSGKWCKKLQNRLLKSLFSLQTEEAEMLLRPPRGEVLGKFWHQASQGTFWQLRLHSITEMTVFSATAGWMHMCDAAAVPVLLSRGCCVPIRGLLVWFFFQYQGSEWQTAGLDVTTGTQQQTVCGEALVRSVSVSLWNGKHHWSCNKTFFFFPITVYKIREKHPHAQDVIIKYQMWYDAGSYLTTATEKVVKYTWQSANPQNLVCKSSEFYTDRKSVV